MVDVSTYGDVLVRDINLRNASLYSNDASNADNSRLSSINFYGKQEGSSINEILGQIKVSHDGTGSDNKGKFVFQINDNSSMVDVFQVDSNKRTTIPKITVSEDLTVNTHLSANSLNVATDTTLETLVVNNTANLNSGINITGATTLTGNLTQAEGYSTSLKGLSVAGNSALNSANVTNDLTVSGNSNLNGPLTVAADQQTTLGGNLTVAAGKQTQLNGPLTVADDQQTTVGSLTVNGDFSAGNINFDGANVTGDLSCDNLTAATSITSNGTLTAAGETTLNGPLSVGSTWNQQSTTLTGSLTVAEGNQTTLTGPLTVAADQTTTLNGNLSVAAGKQTTLSGLLVAMNTSSFLGPLNVAANQQATFNGPLTVAADQQATLGPLDAGATIVDSINVTNASNLNGPLTVAADQQATFNGPLTVAADQQTQLNGPLTVAADQQATFNGPLSVAAGKQTQLNGPLTVAADQQTQLNGPLTVAADQQTTLGPLDAGATTLDSLTVSGDFNAGNINFDGANVTGDLSCDNLTAATSITSNGTLNVVGDSELSILNTSGLATLNAAIVQNNLDVAGNATITGNLFVNGTTTTVNTEELKIEDNIITVNSAPTGKNGGFVVQRSQLDLSGDNNAQVVIIEIIDTNIFRTGSFSTYFSVSPELAPNFIIDSYISQGNNHLKITNVEDEGATQIVTVDPATVVDPLVTGSANWNNLKYSGLVFDEHSREFLLIGGPTEAMLSEKTFLLTDPNLTSRHLLPLTVGALDAMSITSGGNLTAGSTTLNGPLTVAADQEATFNGPLTVAADQEATFNGPLTVSTGNLTSVDFLNVEKIVASGNYQSTLGSVLTSAISTGSINASGQTVLNGEFFLNNYEAQLNAGLSVAAGQQATFNGPLSVAAGQQTTLDALDAGATIVDSINVTNASNLNGPVTVAAGQQSTFNGPLTVAADQQTTLGPLTVAAGQQSTFNGPLTVSAGNLTSVDFLNVEKIVASGNHQSTLGSVLTSAISTGSINASGQTVLNGEFFLNNYEAQLNAGLSVAAGQQSTFNGPLTVAADQQTTLGPLTVAADQQALFNGPLTVATGKLTTVDVLDAGATTLDSLDVSGIANLQVLNATSTNFNDISVSDKMSIGPISPSNVSQYTLALTSQGNDVANPPTLRFDLLPSDGDIASAENDIYGRIDFTARDTGEWENRSTYRS